jgi:hypothetical protein
MAAALLHGEYQSLVDGMTRLALLTDGLAVLRFVIVVVTPETTW